MFLRHQWSCRIAAVAVVFTLAPALSAGPFTVGNLAVERIGGDASFGGAGSAPTNAATAVFVDEITTGGTRVQTIALPTTASGSQLALTDTGTGTSAGYLTLSTDRQSLVVGGYNAAIGTTNVATSSPATINRVIGRINADGTVDTSTGFNNGVSNTFRGVASDGTNTWVTVAGTTSMPGLSVVTTSGSVVATTPLVNGNVRNVAIFNDRLFVSSGSTNPGVGITLVNPGGFPPTSGTPATALVANSQPGTGTGSPYGFVFLSSTGATTGGFDNSGLDRLYIADDRAPNATPANGGGLHRYDWDGSAWVYQYTLTGGLTGGTPTGGGLRGLTGSFVGGNAVLYATTNGTTSGNALVALTDTGSGSGFTALLNSPTNTFFRGVAFAPVPEPGSLLLCGFAGVGFAGAAIRRYRKRSVAAQA